MESIIHLVMKCPFFSDESRALYESLDQAGNDVAAMILNDPQNYFSIIMGKQREYALFKSMDDLWLITGERIRKTSKLALTSRV